MIPARPPLRRPDPTTEIPAGWRTVDDYDDECICTVRRADRGWETCEASPAIVVEQIDGTWDGDAVCADCWPAFVADPGVLS